MGMLRVQVQYGLRQEILAGMYLGRNVFREPVGEAPFFPGRSPCAFLHGS